MRRALLAGFLVLALPLRAEPTANAAGADLRVLDKLTGAVTDLAIAAGTSARVGILDIAVVECRYPTANPSGDAYAELVIRDARRPDPVFAGWMIASAPALSALDHARYDVWVLGCSGI